ncbi:(4Fe-4S)-binding protein [Galbibacter sp. EGI 63066]|uniref:(4Fe-4S)-binding protein n=1 Tax=Galbibacter sp. EGI 63066 TaxID=2993559 RepID=UPI002248986C|nr:(4Fe-4S)-binding protein [Galbibacter sp. EGI 63066]MCX2680814.1 (4Fe-4S)-binding protein [Galbibacter sp. EGI 63066]
MKTYPKENLSIVWEAEKCQHSGICIKLLPKVYNPRERPWIKQENATEEEIIKQVKQCPSGALSIKYHEK